MRSQKRIILVCVGRAFTIETAQRGRLAAIWLSVLRIRINVSADCAVEEDARFDIASFCSLAKNNAEGNPDSSGCVFLSEAKQRSKFSLKLSYSALSFCVKQRLI